jgi:hypothetical protein
VLISIDPGYGHCGVALFEEEVLQKAFLVTTSSRASVEASQFVDMADAVWTRLEKEGVKKQSAMEVAIEYPQQYTQSPAPREAVQRLVGVIGALLARLQSETGGLRVKVSSYKPREWKGQVPKKIMQQRVLDRLAPEERDRIEALPASKVHNVHDAVGVGLHHIKRLKRRRVAVSQSR